MSVRNGILALLADEPVHGYGLKSRFESETGGFWPLNVGQVYTTLARLERDGLVTPEEREPDPARRAWRLTDGGREVLGGWFGETVGDTPLRDELVIKVLLALASRPADVGEIVQAQRSAATARMQAHTRRKRLADPASEMGLVLMLDFLILRAEAEIKWLDLCEARLAAQRPRRGDRP